MGSSIAVRVVLEADSIGDGAVVLAAHGREAMNELSTWRLEILAAAPIAIDDALGTPATIVITDDLDGARRAVGLIIAGVTFEGESAEGLIYTITLAPPEWLLTLRSGYRIFIEKTVPDIITQVLVDGGTPAARIVKRLSGSYGLRLHTAQYAEEEWAFVARLCAEEGISFWFDSTDDGPVIVFGDDPASHDGLEGGPALPFEDPSGMVRGRAIHELELAEELVEGRVHLIEYDVRHPDVLIHGREGTEGPEYFEYPAKVLDEAGAGARARVRLEQLRRFRVRATAKSDSPRLRPGRFVAVEGCSDADLDAEYVVVSVEHRFTLPVRGQGRTSGYENEAVLVPKEGPAHRPAIPGAAPRIDGAESAITTGPGGEEIHVNDLGELKIRFPWDRSGITDDRSSTWIRCLQMGLGGSMLLPRVGWEVPVMYYDGDPDRPLVLGRLYNAQNVVPYGVPAAKATTTLQSATSPGGGSNNEIRMKDDGGAMEMFVHASRDQSVFVGGSATNKVGVNATHDVTLSYALGIKGSETLSVGANQSVNVVTDYNTKVNGARSETVGAVETTKITGNRAIVAQGGYTELVGALYGMQCNQENVDVTGLFSQSVGAALVHGAGIGASESIGGVRVETVGGARTITAAKSYGETVYGAKLVTAGACRVKAGTVATTTTKGAQSTQVGGSATIDAGGPAVFQANQIEIKAASLKAGVLEIGGGAFKISGGTSKLDGKIKRQGGSKIG